MKTSKKAMVIPLHLGRDGLETIAAKLGFDYITLFRKNQAKAKNSTKLKLVFQRNRHPHNLVFNTKKLVRASIAILSSSSG